METDDLIPVDTAPDMPLEIPPDVESYELIVDDPVLEVADEPAVEPVKPAAVQEAPAEKTKPAPIAAKPISRVAQILAITTEDNLLAGMTAFENQVNERLTPVRLLLLKNILTNDVASIQGHMSEVERWRDTVSRFSALAGAFVSHCKSDRFILRAIGNNKITAFDKEAHQQHLLTGFIGIDKDLEQLIRSIDSRVNMCKCLLRLDEAGQYHPNAERVA